MGLSFRVTLKILLAHANNKSQDRDFDGGGCVFVIETSCSVRHSGKKHGNTASGSSFINHNLLRCYFKTENLLYNVPHFNMLDLSFTSILSFRAVCPLPKPMSKFKGPQVSQSACYDI